MCGARRDRALLLTGMMGSGKSTVGRQLAAKLDWLFIDSDRRIEAGADLLIPQIFAREGEAGFRSRERRVLEQLPDRDAVIALGGGAILSETNRELLESKGTLVWLDASPESLAERVGDASNRPLLAGLDWEGRVARLRELNTERAEAYASAALRIETDGLDTASVVDAVLDALGWRDDA